MAATNLLPQPLASSTITPTPYINMGLGHMKNIAPIRPTPTSRRIFFSANLTKKALAAIAAAAGKFKNETIRRSTNQRRNPTERAMPRLPSPGWAHPHAAVGARVGGKPLTQNISVRIRHPDELPSSPTPPSKVLAKLQPAFHPRHVPCPQQFPYDRRRSRHRRMKPTPAHQPSASTPLARFIVLLHAAASPRIRPSARSSPFPKTLSLDCLFPQTTSP